MSGICGIVRPHAKPEDEPAFARMFEAMAPRGRDGGGVWQAGGVTLGLRLFHNTPEALHESGPCVVDHVTVVADVRLDNRDDLFDALGTPHPARAAMTDPELIARAYLRWGDECAPRLIGDFAFALWDARLRRLFCARDVFGTKPFAYARVNDGVLFASDTESLRAAGLLRLTLDPLRVYDAISDRTIEYQEGDRTFWNELRRLIAAHSLVWSSRGMRVERFYRLKSAAIAVPQTDAERCEVFAHLFRRAVASRLRAAGPQASMLSGGLDSGSIVGAAREVLLERGAPPLRTYSVLWGDHSCKETPYAQAVMDGGGLQSTVIGPRDIPSFVPQVVRFLEGNDHAPIDYGSIDIQLMTALCAGRDGSRVLFDGIDGDSAVGTGGDIVRTSLLEGRPLDALRLPLLIGFRAGYPFWPVLAEMANCFSGYLQQDVLLPLSPALYWQRRRRRHRYIVRRAQAAGPGRLPPALLSAMAERSAAARRPYEWPQPDLYNHPLELGIDRRAAASFERADRLAVFAGLEARHPYLDRELVEFCMAVPWRERMVGGYLKSVLRGAGFTPPMHARQSSLMNLNYRARAVLFAAMRPWLDAQLARIETASSWLDRERLDPLLKRWRRHELGPEDPFDFLLRAAVLVRWLELWDSEPPCGGSLG